MVYKDAPTMKFDAGAASFARVPLIPSRTSTDSCNPTGVMFPQWIFNIFHWVLSILSWYVVLVSYW